MYSASFLVLALAVFGASANCGCGVNNGLNGVTFVTGNNGCNGLNGFNGFNGLNGFNGNGVTFVNGLSGVSTGGASTPVLESPTLRLPSVVNKASIQDTCSCVKTVVRPHVRKEVYTFPSVQRFVQTTSSPVVETVPYVTGGSTDVPSGLPNLCNGLSNFVSVNSGLGNVFSGVNSGFGNLVSVNSGLGNFVTGVNSGCGNVVTGVSSGCGNVVTGVNSGCGNVLSGDLVSVNTGLNGVSSGCGGCGNVVF